MKCFNHRQSFKTIPVVIVTVALGCLISLTLVGPAQARQAWFETYGIASKRDLVQATAVPGLIRALSDSSANIRKAAAQYLEKNGPRAAAAVPALATAVTSDPHPNVRAEAAQALRAIGQPALAAAPALIRAMADKDADVRKAAMLALAGLGDRGAEFHAALQQMANVDPHRRVKAEAARALAAWPKTGTLAQPLPPAAPTAPSLALPTDSLNLPAGAKENRYAIAVIIGNRNYSGNNRDVPDVDFAQNDAQAMFDYVTGSLGFREGNVIFLKDATQADLVSTFGSRDNPKGKLYDWVRPNQSDIFVYYSGHGAPSLTNGQGYLLPVDGNPMKVELNGYALETFYANLAKIPARTTTIILDACFSGASASGTVVRNASSISLKLVNTQAEIPKATVLTAAGLSEVASWDETNRHGLFTSYFLKGVTGAADAKDYGNSDGKVTLAELKKYLEEEVTYNARRLYGRDQNPQISGDPNQLLLAQ